MKILRCIICNDEYDLYSAKKTKVGGKINECADCCDETAVKYAGLQAADGKANQTTILKFYSEEDKKKYISFWRNNSGFNKGKSCQLGNHLSTDPNIKFQTIVEHIATNHKGKS